MLKQLGAGDLEAGLQSLQTQDHALEEVSQLIQVDAAVSPQTLCMCQVVHVAECDAPLPQSILGQAR